MMRQDSSISQQTSTSQLTEFFKIKIKHEDEWVVVKMPKDMNYSMLLDKLEERLGTQGFKSIRYQDERAEMFELDGDEALGKALGVHGAKLKLFVAS